MVFNSSIVAICTAPTAGASMQSVKQARAIEGRGLENDRYGNAAGSFSFAPHGNRQVTLINARFFKGTTYAYPEMRRNIVTDGIELMDLIGREFKIGEAIMRGVGYCGPCERPKKLLDKEESSRDAFQDCGGIYAEVIKSGLIKVGDHIRKHI